MSEWLLVFSLMILGIVFMMLEFFVIPGFGFMGFLGLISLGVASYFSYTKLNPFLGVITGIVSIGVIVVLIKMLPHSKFWRKLQLRKEETRAAGYSSTRKGLEELSGKTGTAVTVLRPVGKALIEGKRIDVVAELGMIAEGKEIEVIKVEGNRVVVKQK